MIVPPRAGKTMLAKRLQLYTKTPCCFDVEFANLNMRMLIKPLLIIPKFIDVVLNNCWFM